MKEGGVASGRPTFRQRHAVPAGLCAAATIHLLIGPFNRSVVGLPMPFRPVIGYYLQTGVISMRIRPSLRLARAAMVCALAVGLGAASNAWSQSLIRGAVDHLQQQPRPAGQPCVAAADRRNAGPGRRQLAAEGHAVARVQQDRAGLDFHPVRAPTYYILNGRFTTLASGPAAVPRRQDGGRHQGGPGQHPGAAGARSPTPSRTSCWQAVDLLRRPGARTSASSMRARTTCGC